MDNALETESEAVVRDERHRNRDEPRIAPLPRDQLKVLVGGAAVYAVYRMTQTALFAPGSAQHQFPIGVRIIVSAADGGIMAMLAPVALWMSRRFPLGPPIQWRNLAIHGLVALIAAGGWILALLAVFDAVTHRPFANPIAAENLSWLTSNLFAYALFVAVLHALSFQHRLREREVHAARLESRLTTARLETLRAQLHPHFLFNTLHTISELIHIDPAAADAMVIRLGRLLRVSLDLTSDDETPLRRELDVVATYLDLQRMRHGDRLVVEFDADPAIGEALVPPLLLQPLAENALRHGIGSRSSLGHIWISARAEGGTLELAVKDDGIGLAGGASEGLGLKNTRHRLAELYGDRHSFRVGPRNGGGVEAVIRIPLRMSAIVSARSAE